MIVIKNNSKSVKVLKAVGMPALRLFPGMNRVDIKDPGIYTTSDAARGMFKECLTVQTIEGMSLEDKQAADAAKEKNDTLNRAQKIIAKKDSQLETAKAAFDKQAETIADLTAKVEALMQAATQKPRKR